LNKVVKPCTIAAVLVGLTYLWNSDLVTLLEELGVLLDEISSWHVLDGDAILVVDQTQI